MASALPATEITALLGRGTHFEGKLHFEGRVRIDGTFRGEIRGDDALVIGDGAEVEAEIEVGVVIVKGGVLTGNVRAVRASTPATSAASHKKWNSAQPNAPASGV